MSSIEALVSNSTLPGPTGPIENPGALLDRDAFLKLLVAQLKYQDPNNPADTSQMVTQSAQLTMVDRLNEIAESLTASNGSDRLTLAGSLVGREVSFVGTDGYEARARVDSVRFEAGALTVLAGGTSVPAESITQIWALAPVTTTA